MRFVCQPNAAPELGDQTLDTTQWILNHPIVASPHMSVTAGNQISYSFDCASNMQRNDSSLLQVSFYDIVGEALCALAHLYDMSDVGLGVIVRWRNACGAQLDDAL